MKKTIAKHYFELCEHAFNSTDKRVAFTFPDWINAFKNGKKDAQTIFISIQSALLMLSQERGKLQSTYPKITGCQNLPTREFFEACKNLYDLGSDHNSYNPLKDACDLLAAYAKFENINLQNPEASIGYLNQSFHQLATEAFQRDASSVTPIDVVELMMAQISDAEKIDTYALDGFGLLYAVRDKKTACLVGDDLGREGKNSLPKSLKNINSESLSWFRSAEFANKQFIEFEWSFNEPAGQGDALLVNAAKADMPFLAADQSINQIAGSLNHCLNAGYKKIVVLVSNHYLTAGRGLAQQILDFCLKNGLRKVIQLPMGVLGFKSQQHSLLVFQRDQANEMVEFEDLSSDENIKIAPRGFGEPRRARTLQSSGDGYWGPNYVVSSTNVKATRLSSTGKAANGSRLLSFEVSQFLSLSIDPLKDLRDTYKFMKIHEFMEVFRSHHIEDTGEASRVDYVEVGANSISDFGWIGSGKKRDCSVAALNKRKAQVLKDKDIVLCFRGAADTFGKTGFYRKVTVELAVPNQSFVILRMKETAPFNAPSAELVLWWLRSPLAQLCLKQKAISPDVVRVAPKDIARLEIPCGPDYLIAKEIDRINEVNDLLLKIDNIKNDIITMEKLSWQKTE